MRVFLIIAIVFGLIISACANKPQMVAQINVGNLIIRGFDIDYDPDIDYWQHYKWIDGQWIEFGDKIWVKERSSRVDRYDIIVGFPK
jgi:hypothetical protein